MKQPTIAQKELILFDFDGVLVDSFRLSYESGAALVAQTSNV